MKDFSYHIPSGLRHVDTWVFDLDNTLYDAESHVFVEVGSRMTQFVAKHLGLPVEEANKVRRDFFHKYGTTLRGLMSEHGVPPDDFLHHVHDIDLSPVSPCAITQEYLAHLPGRKIVFTNAPRAFAQKMTRHLGIDRHFDAIFAIEDAAYWPKPKVDTYHEFFRTHGVAPRSACMFEDMEVNLKPAHDLGMTTVWFHGKNPPPDHAHVHHRAEKLSHWLTNTIRKD